MKTIKIMYEHLIWANYRILAALQNEENSQANIQADVKRLFTHLLFAEKVWIARIQGIDSSHLPIWSQDNREDLTKLVNQNEEMIHSFLKYIEKTDMDSIISYKNSNGIPFHNSIRDILIHLALHGQYHRGQINLKLRANQVEPINVDYMTYVRSPF